MRFRDESLLAADDQRSNPSAARLLDPYDSGTAAQFDHGAIMAP